MVKLKKILAIEHKAIINIYMNIYVTYQVKKASCRTLSWCYAIFVGKQHKKHLVFYVCNT